MRRLPLRQRRNRPVVWTVSTALAHDWSVWEWLIGVGVNLSFWAPLLIDGCTRVEVGIHRQAVVTDVWNPFSGWESASFKASEYDDIGSIGWTFQDAMFRLRSGDLLTVRMPYSKGVRVHQILRSLPEGEGG